jgi:hypothetical protein
VIEGFKNVRFGKLSHKRLFREMNLSNNKQFELSTKSTGTTIITDGDIIFKN